MSLLTLDEAAEALRVSKDTVRRRVRKFEISVIIVGRQWRFEKDALEDYKESRTVKASKRKSATFKA